VIVKFGVMLDDIPGIMLFIMLCFMMHIFP